MVLINTTGCISHIRANVQPYAVTFTIFNSSHRLQLLPIYLPRRDDRLIGQWMPREFNLGCQIASPRLNHGLFLIALLPVRMVGYGWQAINSGGPSTDFAMLHRATINTDAEFMWELHSSISRPHFLILAKLPQISKVTVGNLFYTD